MRVRTALCVVSLAGALVAQDVDEAKFLKDSAARLGSFATRCFKSGYPARAREVWLEVLREYDPDDDDARTRLGFLRVGSSWAPDPRFSYPGKDEPDAAVARILEKQWEVLAKGLGDEHSKVARALEPRDPARAQYHFQRALRFVPDEAAAVKARGIGNFEGFLGTADEVTLLRRSRLLERAVALLLDKSYKVTRLADKEKQPYLDKAGVGYIGVESEHFTVWGDWEQEVLSEAAQFAERSLDFAQQAYAGYDGFRWIQKDKAALAFFKTREAWSQVLRANEELFRPGQLEFVLVNTSATTMGMGPGAIRVGGVEDKATVLDLAVRWIAQEYSGLGTDAMVEGIGHAVVGLFFGRNLVFTVGQEQERARTSSGERRRALQLRLPEIEVWRELAVEAAWSRSDLAAARLPLLSAADFPDEGRIKAWSLCDYLLRRDPRLMQVLDRTKGQGARNEGAVAQTFAEKNGGLTLASIDDDWRRFWTDDTPLLRAVRNKSTPLESVSKTAPVFLEQFNALRTQNGRSPVGWSAEYSDACRQHAEYLRQNGGERGPAGEHTQERSKKGYTNAGRTFAERALVSTNAKDAKKAMASWLDWPGYRDAIVNPQLEVVGLWAEGSILVMDVLRGQGGNDGRLSSTTWPNNDQKEVPPEVQVKELGPELVNELKRRGLGKLEVLGYPLTFHCFRGSAMPKRDSIRCTLKRFDKDEVEGIVVVADGGNARRTSAPGLVVFYPIAPLARGSEFTVEWSYTRTDGGMEPTAKTKFTTR
jgi:uncharacterized protein YkwD